MSGGKQALGYTIVEVMIVLAVSGAMFALAAVFIAGKQESSSFRAGVNEFASRMQSVIDSVNSGQYTDLPVNCNGSGGGSLSINPPAGQVQGTNDSCVFLGKVVHLQEGGEANKYEVFMIAGRRYLGSSKSPVTSLAEASPAAIYIAGNGDLTTHSVVPQNLEIKKVTVYPVGGSPNYTATAFGIVQGLGTGSTTFTGNYASGGQTLGLVYSPDVGGADGISAAAGKLRSIPPASSLLAAQGVKICLTDSYNNGTRFAEVSIGSDSYTQINVKTKQAVTACS